MTSTSPDDNDDTAGLVLFPLVAAQVVALAAEHLTGVAEQDLPRSLRPVRRFAPHRRARLGGVALAAAVESDAVFRSAVACGLRRTDPELAGQVEAGRPPPAAPPARVAAFAYLLRPPGWRAQVERAEQALRSDREQRSVGEAAAEVDRLTAQVEQMRTAARLEAERVRGDRAALQQEIEQLRRQVRGGGDRVRRAEAAASQAHAEAQAGRGAVAEAEARAARSEERLQAALDEADRAGSVSREAGRAVRLAEQVRVRILLDALVASAQGLRRELALPPAAGSPADEVVRSLAGGAPPAAASPFAAFSGQGRPPADPALIDQVLAVPGVHLIVDGYNVTKLGYPTLALEAQRRRLLASLAPVAAAYGAEVTVVFDGGARPDGIGPVAHPRGLRVLFSPPGRIADAVIVALVAAEPPGRAVAVVTDDREVVDAVRRGGAYPVASGALLGRLAR